MKWFMHQSAASADSKLRKVRMRYGAEGLGLYWYCLEEICANVDPKLTFELESDSEILAHELKIDTLRVEEMMRYMVTLGLFDLDGDTVSCMKLARYLGDRNTRNPDLQRIIRQQKDDLSATVPDSPGLSRTVPDSPRLSGLEERRVEEKKEKAPSRRFTPPTLEDVTAYCTERGNSVSPQKFLDHYEANGWMRGKTKVKDWRACVRTWEGNQPKGESNATYF